MTAAKRRVCIVMPAHWTAATGGSQYQVQCILDALIPLERYEFHFVAHRAQSGYQPEGYKLHKVGSSGRPPRLGYLLAGGLPLYRTLCEIAPDVIYQRVACGYTGVAAYYARRRGARLVWHVAHDTDVMRGAELDAGANFIRRFFEKRSIEYGIAGADDIVVQTDRQAQLLRENYARNASAVVLNFQPPPVEHLDKDGPFTIVWVANFKPWKQPEALVRLAAAVRDLNDVRFVMIGAPPDDSADAGWRQTLMQDIQASANIEYLGKKSQGEVNAILARAHLFVNTSLQEGFANTFIQAWARGVPVLSLNINPDGLFDRESVGVHTATEQGLAEAVRMFVADKRRLELFSARAIEYCRLRHSVHNAVELARLFDA